MSIIAISDYGKGFLTPSLLNRLIQEAKKREIPVIVDPKGIDFSKYKGATLLKPNLSEAYAAARLTMDYPLEAVGNQLLQQTGIESLVVTRSKEGISLFTKNASRMDFPAVVREVKDVTGAGDTVLAVIASAMANRVDLSLSCELANVAAGIAVERVGCARISLEDLTRRLLEVSV